MGLVKIYEIISAKNLINVCKHYQNNIILSIQIQGKVNC